MITIGSKLLLHNKPDQYQIDRFEFSTNENGQMDSFIRLTNLASGKSDQVPVIVVLELLRCMQLYVPEQLSLAVRYHEAVTQHREALNKLRGVSND